MKKLLTTLCVHLLFLSVCGQFKTAVINQASASAGIDPATYLSKGINDKYSFTNKWLFSQVLGNYTSTTGLPGASGTIRGMAVLNGKMMFPDRANKQIVIVNGLTGVRENPLQLASNIFTYTGRNKANTADSVWTAGALTHNDLKVDNAGNVLISNLITANTGRFQVWKINMTTGAGSIVIDQADLASLFPMATNMRFDAFGVTGDVNTNATIMAVNASDMEVYKWSISSGIAGTPSLITLKNNISGTDFYNLTNLGSAPQVFPLNENTFYVDGHATNPVLVDGTGTPLGGFIQTFFPNDLNVTKGHNGVVEFNMGGENFLVAAYSNNLAAPPSAFKLYRFTDSAKSFAGLEELWMFPQAGMGSTSNPYRSAIPAVEISGRTAKIYVYTGENGYGMYEFKIAEDITTNLQQEFGVNLSIYHDSETGNLRVNGIVETALIEIFNLSGRLMLNAPVNEVLNSINVSNLAHGVYFYRINQKDKVNTGRFIVN
jgi:hypothetical protein